MNYITTHKGIRLAKLELTTIVSQTQHVLNTRYADRDRRIWFFSYVNLLNGRYPIDVTLHSGSTLRDSDDGKEGVVYIPPGKNLKMLRSADNGWVTVYEFEESGIRALVKATRL